MKKCGKCLNYLEENLFSFRKGRLQSFCKECQSKYAKEYRQKNKERLRNNLKKWRKTNSSDREITEKQKLEEQFRATLRRLLKSDSEKIHKIFGYSAKELKDYLIDQFGNLPNNEFILSYKEPLKNFDLNQSDQKRMAARLENLLIEKKP